MLAFIFELQSIKSNMQQNSQVDFLLLHFSFENAKMLRILSQFIFSLNYVCMRMKKGIRNFNRRFISLKKDYLIIRL